jgi:putative membrane protein
MLVNPNVTDTETQLRDAQHREAHRCISASERYAEIVADSGINAKLPPPDAWANAVSALISGIKAGRPGDGFVAAVELCGAELARNFPPGELNPNELPGRVVEI